MKSAKIFGALILAAAAAGCAINAVPADQIALAERAIGAAREAGAAQAAKEELHLAEEKLQLGRRWAQTGDFKPARWLAEQAQVDAEVAMLKAMSARARHQAQELTAEFRAIRARAAQ